MIPIIFNVMKRLNLIFLLVLLCYLISCNRKGYTDPKAMGSNPGAKKDCCCLYETSLVIWFDEQTIQNLEADFISNLTYYLDGDSISRSDLSYTDSLLMCHHINSLTYNKELGEVDTYTGHFQAYSDSNDLIFEKTIHMKGGECLSVKVEY